tara:strand:+ start:14570 stop:15028 length:459 start_codon:yes stop_codon:yes gene_type:complete
MARRKKLQAAVEPDPGLDMSSLIDVSFLLLIYFIATSTLKPEEADLGMTLPTTDSSSSSKVEIDQMSINLTGEGAVSVNDEVLDNDVNSRSLPQLKERLVQYKSAADLSESTPVVILSAQDSAKSQRFIDVLNTLADVGINSVTLAGFDQGG